MTPASLDTDTPNEEMTWSRTVSQREYNNIDTHMADARQNALLFGDDSQIYPENSQTQNLFLIDDESQYLRLNNGEPPQNNTQIVQTNENTQDSYEVDDKPQYLRLNRTEESSTSGKHIVQQAANSGDPNFQQLRLEEATFYTSCFHFENR